VRRGSCIVLKRGLVPTRDSGRDIVMEVWKENTATVTIAGASMDMDYLDIQVVLCVPINCQTKDVVSNKADFEEN